MNREIKFRAWDKIFGGRLENICVFQYGNVSSDEVWIPNKDVALMQYTGLKDKNDKEIFEGDIVKYSWDGKSGISEVKWKYGEWNVTDFGNNAGSLNIYNTENEIIGNIYENPEPDLHDELSLSKEEKEHELIEDQEFKHSER